MTAKKLEKLAKQKIDLVVPSPLLIAEMALNFVLNELDAATLGVRDLSNDDREALADLMQQEAYERYLVAFPKSLQEGGT